MVRELERVRQNIQFPETAPAANPVFFRTYSRRRDSRRETWEEVCDRTVGGLAKLGQLTPDEATLIYRMQSQIKTTVGARFLWIGGTSWFEKPENFSGGFNCTSRDITDWESFGIMMDLAMMGCGTGAVLEPKYINQLPKICNHLIVNLQGQIGSTPPHLRHQETEIKIEGNLVYIRIGDSRQGWVKSYQTVLELSSNKQFSGKIQIFIDLSDVRPVGETLKGFGGVANPVKLSELYQRCASVLNQAVGRQLNSLECCLLIDQAAACVVAGNIRRSAGMRQGDSNDPVFTNAKTNLWQQDASGKWRIDPQRDVLRMSNHTRVFHHKPTFDECLEAVRQQFNSGEGAIQWAGEALARANCDLLRTPELKTNFLKVYDRGKAQQWLQELNPNITTDELDHRLARYALNPCGEIIGTDFHCNLSQVHLDLLDPDNFKEQEEAFTAAALSVAALLKRGFLEQRFQKSREIDPIVGVSFGGLFDFFVKAFGVEWLHWWVEGRPETTVGLEFKRREREYLTRWKEIAHQVVWDYCDRHNLTKPNRCTTVQPSGTKVLLTGGSPGWHPPKSQRFLRRITFAKNDPVALACIDYGYNVVPSQDDKDENGNLLNDPFDPRCSVWLVEIPTEISWANLPGADEIEIEKFSALAQFDFYMQVQRYYTTHNTSATIELTESEIELVGQRIYQAIQNDEGYISVALLARFNAPFPRLPFEKIDWDTYKRLQKEVKARQKIDDFYTALIQYDKGYSMVEGPAGCDSDKCMSLEQKMS
jgi:ribonucleotide reductase, class II